MNADMGVSRTHRPYWMQASILLGILFWVGIGIAAGQQIAGSYKHRGRKTVHRIVIPSKPPVAAIVVEYLPPGTKIEKATPPYSSYDSKKGIVKWLYPNVQPGTLRIKLYLKENVRREDVRVDVLFKDSSGGSSTFSVRPREMRSAAIEGC